MIPLYAIGWPEIAVIAGVIFVLFGATRIPAAFRALGEGINSFKEGLEGNTDKSAEEGETQTAAPPSEAGEAGSASSK